jgi:hypothetical protein
MYTDKKREKNSRTSRDEVETGFSKAGAMSMANGNAQRARRRKRKMETQ